MIFRKKPEPQLPTYFVGAPAEFTEAWNDLSDPARIRREMAALLLTEMRATGLAGRPTATTC